MKPSELLRKQFLAGNNVITKHMSDRSLSAQQKIKERLKKSGKETSLIRVRITNDTYNKLFHLAHYKQLRGDYRANVSSVINYAIDQFLKVIDE